MKQSIISINNLLLTAAGLLALSATAFAVDASYDYDPTSGIYTFTSNGSVPASVNLNNNAAVKGVTLNPGVELTYGGDLDFAGAEGELQLYGASKLTTNQVFLSEGNSLAVKGDSEISVRGMLDLSAAQINLGSNLTLKSSGDLDGSTIYISFENAALNMNLNTIGTDTAALTLSLEYIADYINFAGMAINLTIDESAAGDYKLIELTDSAVEDKESYESAAKTLRINGRAANNSALRWDGNTLVYTAVPEPSMFGLLAGVAALALVGTRRRRK